MLPSRPSAIRDRSSKIWVSSDRFVVMKPSMPPAPSERRQMNKKVRVNLYLMGILANGSFIYAQICSERVFSLWLFRIYKGFGCFFFRKTQDIYGQGLGLFV